MSRVKVEIHADKSGFDSAVKGVEHSIEGLKEMVVGAFTVEAVKSIVEKTFEYADSIDKASLRMKMTTEQTQALSIMAKDAGSSLGVIEAAFKKIETARAKALGGNAKALAGFKALGIDTSELAKPNNTLGLATTMSKAAATGSNDREGVALGALGLKKSAGDLAVLSESLEDFNGKLDELKARGAIMEDKDIANIVRAKDELEIVGTTLMAKVAPWLSQLIEGIEEGWIILSTTAENTFAAIYLMAQHTIDYIKGLGASLMQGGKGALSGAVTGFATGGVAGAATGFLTGAFTKDNKLTKDFIGNIKSDVSQTFEANDKELTEKLNAYTQGIAKKMEERAKARENKDHGVDTVTPPKTTKQNMKLYSDSLTASGNMIGASFQGAKSVTTSLDVAKQHLSESKTQTEQLEKLNESLAQVVDNTEPNELEDTWP